VNLIVEQGNTSIKIALFNNDRIVSSFFKDKNDSLWLPEIIERYHPEKGIMCSVVDRDEPLSTALSEQLPYFLWLDERIPTPLHIEYKTPDTLGKDRLAAAVGANFLQPGKNGLVIDAGTAITYEVVEASGVYKGGNISPGMTTRFRSLHQYTKRLPYVTEKEAVPQIGTDTESAILAGVVNGMVFEMDGYIDQMKAQYGDIFVFLTGGHSFYFERRLKNSIFADANLVLVGLNRILDYNARKN
jgi:type III pantothenate kinase